MKNDELNIPPEVRRILREQEEAATSQAQAVQGDPQVVQPQPGQPEGGAGAALPTTPGAEQGSAWRNVPMARTYLGHAEKFAADTLKFADKVLKNGQPVDPKSFAAEVAALYPQQGDVTRAAKGAVEKGKQAVAKGRQAVEKGGEMAQRADQAVGRAQQRVDQGVKSAGQAVRNWAQGGSEGPGAQAAGQAQGGQQLRPDLIQNATQVRDHVQQLMQHTTPEATQYGQKLVDMLNKLLQSRNMPPEMQQQNMQEIDRSYKAFLKKAGEWKESLSEALGGRVPLVIETLFAECERLMMEVRVTGPRLQTALSGDNSWLRVMTPDGNRYELHTNYEGGWTGTGTVSRSGDPRVSGQVLQKGAQVAGQAARGAAGVAGKALGALGRAAGAVGKAGWQHYTSPERQQRAAARDQQRHELRMLRQQQRGEQAAATRQQRAAAQQQRAAPAAPRQQAAPAAPAARGAGQQAAAGSRTVFVPATGQQQAPGQPQVPGQQQARGQQQQQGYRATGSPPNWLDSQMNNPEQFLQQMYAHSPFYKMAGYAGGKGMAWSVGKEKLIDKMRQSGVQSIDKMPDEGKYSVYRVKPFNGRAAYFYTKRSASQLGASLHMDPSLRALVEQSVMDDPRREAPQAAFDYGPPTAGMPQGEPEPEVEQPMEPEVEQPPQDQARDDTKPPTRVVLTQKNTWWETDWTRFLEFLAHGATDAAWNIDNYASRLPGQPNDVKRLVFVDEDEPRYYSTRPDTNVYNVQGWRRDRFMNELTRIEAAIESGMPLVEPKVEDYGDDVTTIR